MRGKLLPLLLALCLMLTACGAPSVSELPDDAATESQPSVPAFDFQAEGLPLSELLAQAAAGTAVHAGERRPRHDLGAHALGAGAL